MLLLPVVLVMPGYAAARKKSQPAKPDHDYVAALATADRFLHSWQAGDQEAGLMMLSDAAKQRWSEDRMEQFFSTGENAAYEISRGQKLNTGRYAFPVTLFGSAPRKGHRRERLSAIVVVQDGEEWEIDKLPLP